MSGTLALALAEVPSPKLAISVKPAPLPNTVGFRSDANTKNAPPSATPKLTVPVPALSSAPSRLPAAPSAQCAVAGSVSQTPPPPARRSSSRVTVRAPLPAWMVTRKLPSSAPSALKAPLPCPTLSRTLPRNAGRGGGGGGVTVNPPVSTTVGPSGFDTVTSRAPIAAVAPTARATESWADDATVVELTVMPAPNPALAPAWKFAPVTVTVRLAPGAPELGDTLEIVGMSGKLTVALAEVPSPKLAVSVKPAPLPNTVGLRSDANTKNAPPSATPKLTVPVPALSSAPSRLPAAPSAQCAVAGSVSQTPPPPARRSSSRVTVRAPLPAWMVTRKLPSSAPSALKAPLPCPTLSRSLPRNARPSVGGGGVTVKPPVSTTVCPSGFDTVTSRAPIAAVAPIARATESWADETTVVELTVMPAPNAALAPAWKFVPVTLTVRLAPGAPELGDTLEIVGMSGTLALALAEVPSPKLAISVKPAPLPNTVGFRSDANTKNAPPSATPKLTVPVPALSSAPSRLAPAPSAQCAVAGSVSQTPPPPARRSSSRVTVRAPLPAPTVTRKLPSSAPSALKAVLPCPTLSRSLPRNARPSVGGGGVTVKPPVSTADCPSGVDTVTSRAPIAAVAPITRATESWADETTVVELTVMPAPNAALAPAPPVRRLRVVAPAPAAAGPAQPEPRHGLFFNHPPTPHLYALAQRAALPICRIALPHLVPQLAEKRQAEHRRRRGDREAARQHHRLAVGIRHRHVARAHRRRGPDREGHRELGGRRHRRRADRDAGAERGACPGLEVRAGHRDGEARSLNPAARRHAGDRRRERHADGRAGRGAVAEVSSQREAGSATERREVQIGREYEERPAVGDAEAHRPVPGVEQGAVEAR